LEGETGGTLKSQTVSTKLQKIAEQAEENPQMVFITLAHHMDVDFLREAYRQTRKDGAPGVDGVTAKEYEQNLDSNLRELHERLKSGKYKAPPVLRTWIEKDNGKKRPIGKPTFEDKIVQRAVVMLIEPIYEQIFHDFSHGFRRERNQHQALKELRENLYSHRTNWVVIADIEGLFDNLDHGILRELIKKRMNDGTLIRLIGKWLNAGVMENRSIHYSETGTPQGGVVSPILSNIFLHYVLDDWFKQEVQPRLKGKSFMIRWADDFIIAFEDKSDAERVMEVLPKRFEKYKLNLHPDKTSLIRFARPKTDEEAKELGTFDFLGFTHYWGKGYTGVWAIKKKTSKKRLTRFLKRTWQWCKENMHELIDEQYKTLCSKLRGFYQYFGVRCNYKALETAYFYVYRTWAAWLSRRTRGIKVRCDELKKRYPLPRPRIVHNI
jgi:RNA-directed DNA polymerase